MTTGETLRSAKPWFAQLNSLRAIAFLLVFLFHDAKLPTGYIGVDLFFVISGYLITSLLMWELEQKGTIDLRSFFLRRTLRIWPAYYTLLVVCYAVSPAAGRTVIISQLPFLATFTANFSYIFSFQRLEAGGIAAWLLPLWSISIEEQFYLFWSVALQRVKAVTSLTVGLVVCCLLLRLALYFVAKVFPEAAPTPYLYYFNTASHADGLLIGALLAQRPQWFAHPALFVVSMVCFWLTPQFDQNVFVVFSFTANAIFFATVIVQLKQWNGIAFLNHLGERSYGMYLWHYPVIVMLGGIASLSLGVTYVVASLSWNLIESKALRLKTLYAS